MSNRAPNTIKKIRHVRVQDDVWIEAAQNAEKEGLTISELVRDLLKDYNRARGEARKPRRTPA